jgi:putative heme-binding domain-containing protein
MLAITPSVRKATILVALLAASSSALADDPPRPEGALTKALKRVPAERQGPVIDMIGKRGTPADLDYVFEQALPSGSFTGASRRRALEALIEAAQTRDSLPGSKVSRLGTLIEAGDKNVKLDPTDRLLAVRLAGLWKVRGLTKTLRSLASEPGTNDTLRASCLDALATIGGPEAREAISALTSASQPANIRVLAIASLARLDIDQATDEAAQLLRNPGGLRDLTPLLSALLSSKVGADRLVAAIAKHSIPADSARLALRAVFGLGRSDPDLVAALTKAAGLNAEVKPLDKSAMDTMIADVGSKGNAERGERIFRRADLGCIKCHALSGAGGGVGPDLSPIGSSSPVDYIVNSIMLPDQAIKEEFQTLVVQTLDGQVFQGIVADKDDKRIILKEATGSLRTVPAAEIDESKAGGSLMPKGLVNFLTRAEFVDLVRFLSELGKPGPYAIRSTPTIQRWQYLKPVPSMQVESVPGPESFRAEVLEVEESHWFPAYAMLAGVLPLDEITADTGSTTAFLRSELQASQGGMVQIKLNSSDGVAAWLDDKPVGMFTDSTVPTDLPAGHHILTFRIDAAHRSLKTLRAEVLKPEGSSAEYSVVGGR